MARTSSFRRKHKMKREDKPCWKQGPTCQRLVCIPLFPVHLRSLSHPFVLLDWRARDQERELCHLQTWKGWMTTRARWWSSRRSSPAPSRRRASSPRLGFVPTSPFLPSLPSPTLHGSSFPCPSALGIYASASAISFQKSAHPLFFFSSSNSNVHILGALIFLLGSYFGWECSHIAEGEKGTLYDFLGLRTGGSFFADSLVGYVTHCWRKKNQHVWCIILFLILHSSCCTHSWKTKLGWNL